MGQQDGLMYPLEPQTTPRTGKIPSRGPSVVPELSPLKLPTRMSSLWALSAPPHSSEVQAETHNGAANMPDNKEI